jgi:deoxyribodipyrimidine photo-lyase
VSAFLYRFTRDLRVDDHAGLAEAAAHGEVIPVLVIDRALEARVGHSPRRAAFFCGAVAALDAALRERGARLIVRRGAAGPALKSVARASGALGVAWCASYDAQTIRSDIRLQSELEEAGLRATVVHDAPAIAPDDIAHARSNTENGYRAFAPYYEQWRAHPVGTFDAPVLLRFAQTELQSEPLPQPNDFGTNATGARVDAPEGGTTAARAALERFLAECATQYAVAVNVPADDRTSHLSAHLSFGTISAREVVRAAARRLEDPFLLTEERASVRLFLRSAAMRDFFLQLAHFNPQTQDAPLQERMAAFPAKRTHASLDAWRGGRTGYPLVDAGIRQLHETGWMHPHVRAVAASFLCFDLGVDWRVGRDEWDRWLVEDDPALATGNWQWIAGVGADMAQYPRIYNPEKQRRRFDPAGAYVKRWIPELRHVPLGALRPNDGQLALPLFSADDGYARPVVDHAAAARAYLERYRDYVDRH